MSSTDDEKQGLINADGKKGLIFLQKYDILIAEKCMTIKKTNCFCTEKKKKKKKKEPGIHSDRTNIDDTFKEQRNRQLEFDEDLGVLYNFCVILWEMI